MSYIVIRILMIMFDYYSNSIEVERLTTYNYITTTSGTCKSLKGMFSRYGIPDKLVLDNGPQFSTMKFTKFVRDWGFQHLTSSPWYPKSNRMVEISVNQSRSYSQSTYKDSGQSEHLYLLHWHNTPSKRMKTSPAHRF